MTENPHSGKSIFIAVPAGNQTVTAHTMHSVFAVGQMLMTGGIKSGLQWLSLSDISDARNLFLSIWYDLHPEMTHLLFVDSDMQFHPYLVRDMIVFDQPLTGVLYSKRETTGSVVGKVLTGQETIRDTVNGFLRVQGVGCGVMLVARKVVDAILAKNPDLVDTSEGHPISRVIREMGGKRIIRAFDKLPAAGGGQLSEDFSFCQRWRDCGGEVWANVSHPIGHIGPFNYALCYGDFLRFKEDERIKAQASEAA